MSFEVPLTQLLGLLLATVRIISFVTTAPPFSHKGFNRRSKVALGFALALVVSPAVPESLLVSGLSDGQFIAAIITEVLIGVSLGFLCQVIFLAAQAAGGLIDIFGGFSMTALFDQQLGGNVSALSRLYHMTALALLFVSNGHLLILRGLFRTFEVLPLGSAFSMTVFAPALAGAITQLVVTALQIAAPLIAVLFLTDVGLGLMTRIAPQIQIFQLSFPLKIAVTFMMVAAGFALLPNIVQNIIDNIITALAAVTKR